MKIILSLLLMAILSSCSQPNSTSKTSEPTANEDIIDFGELSFSVPATGIPAAPQSMDFASIAFKQTGVQSILITNSSSSLNVTYSSQDFDSSLIAPFVITSNGCIGTIQPRKKCKIDFSLSNPTSLQSEQNLTSLFKIKEIDITLTGILAADPTDYSTPAVSISVTPLELNFGVFKVGESKELSVVIRNNGTASAPSSLTSINNPNVTIESNSCGVSLPSRRPCVLKLKYTGVAGESKSFDNLLKIANYQVTHSATITSPSVQEPEVLNIEPSQPSTTISIAQPQTQTGSISYRNTGSVNLLPPVSAVSSDDGIIINSISCVGGLSRSKICNVSYTINSSLLPPGASVQSIRLQSGTIASENLAVNVTVTAGQSSVCASCAKEISYLDPQVPSSAYVPFSGSTNYILSQQSFIAPTHSFSTPAATTPFSGSISFITSPQPLIAPLPRKQMLPNGEQKYVFQNQSPSLNLESTYQEIIANLSLGLFSPPSEPSIQIPLKRYVLSQVSNIHQDGSYDAPFDLTVFNGELYFSASINENYHRKLFKVNSAGVISQVSNINDGERDDPSQLIVVNNELYFISQNGSFNNKLFKVNAAGVVSQVTNINDGQSDEISFLTEFNNELYFKATTPTFHDKLFKVNSLGAVSQVTNIRAGNSDSINNLTVFNGHLYFSARINASNHVKLMKVNAAGVVSQVSNTNNGGRDNPSSLTIYSGNLYFVANSDLSNNRKLFKINSLDEVFQVSNILDGSDDNLSHLKVFNNELYFQAPNSVSNSKLFKINDSGVITQVSNIYDGERDDPYDLFEFNNELYFVANDLAYNSKLFKVNIAGVVSQVADISDGVYDFPADFTIFKNELYFTAYIFDPLKEFNRKLFKVNTSGVVSQVSDINSADGDGIGDITEFNGQLYFKADTNGSYHSKLFKLTTD